MANNWLDYCKTFIPKIKARHKEMLGRECNLENPQRLTDKLEWLKVYDSTFLKTYCADKLTARKYVASKLGKDISIPVLGAYDKFDDIDFSKLPKDYVIKTNHGSHTNIIVRNGKLDKVKTKKQFDEWMSHDWSWWGYELHYIPIPRKVYIEPFIQNNGISLNDYKFWCFNGIPKMFTINGDNGHGGINYYNLNGELLNVSNNEAPSDPNKHWDMPKTFSQMKKYASILSEPFKFVRVDFYEIQNQCTFGELTFIPGAAYIQYTPDTTDYIFGGYLQL